MKKKISIIDYGAGNILSVNKAFCACGAKVEVLSEPKKIKDASFLVLPGDGSFKFAASQLKKKGLFEIIKKHVKKGNPLLGICLGMQLLLSKSEEFGKSTGISIIKGDVIKIKRKNSDNLKLPVIGWHSLIVKKKNSQFKAIKSLNNKEFYFIHSYQAIPDNKNDILAYYKYGNEKITALIRKENVIGMQFHPEKSGKNGIQLIKTFLNN
jgi:glutamine amidotransferase